MKDLILKFAGEDVVRIFREGTGDNLSNEDIEEGYVDYIYEEQDNIKTKEINVDGACWTLKEYFVDMFKTEEDLAKYVALFIYDMQNMDDVFIYTEEEYESVMGFAYEDREEVEAIQFENTLLKIKNKTTEEER